MTFPNGIKRGRIKGLGGNVIKVRRYISDKYNTYYENKDKKKKKIDKGQCKISIPRSIADELNLRDGDLLEFIHHTKDSVILRKCDVDELE